MSSPLRKRSLPSKRSSLHQASAMGTLITFTIGRSWCLGGSVRCRVSRLSAEYRPSFSLAHRNLSTNSRLSSPPSCGLFDTNGHCQHVLLVSNPSPPCSNHPHRTHVRSNLRSRAFLLQPTRLRNRFLERKTRPRAKPSNVSPCRARESPTATTDGQGN
jgi:hypothetical protein